MNSIQKYINSTINFTASLVFKFEMHREYINNLWYKLYGYIPNTPYEEKYYLNLAGIKAPYDPPVYIYIPAIKNYTEFNKEILDKYPDIKNTLLSRGNEYKQLINDNLYMATYINGVLNPIDIDTAINAEDGDLLYYDTAFLNHNELDIIPEIEKFVKKILYTYNVKDYTIDEFYIHGLTSVIYNNLPAYILTLKIKNILTYKADRFNILNHITSFGGLTEDNYDFLNLPSLIWLYGNINYIKTNLGKNEILDNILTHIYQNNQIGVNKIKVIDSIPKQLTNNLSNPTKPIYEKNKIFVTKKGNKYGTDNIIYTLNDILEIEENNGYINETIYDSTISKYNNDLNTLGDNDVVTKDLMFNQSELILNEYKTVIELLFPVLTILINDANITSNIYYTDPINNKERKYTKEEIYFLYIYSILKYINLETNITINQVELSFDYTASSDFENIVNILYHKELVKPYYDYVVNLKKTIPSIKNINEINIVIHSLSQVLFKIKNVFSNISDIYLLNDFAIIVNTLFPSTIVKINNDDMSLEEYVSVHYPQFLKITSNEARNLIQDMSRKIFNIIIDEKEILKEIFNKYINVGNLYKSYTIKYLYNLLNFTDIISHNQPYVIGNNLKGYNKILEARYKRMDHIYFDFNITTYSEEKSIIEEQNEGIPFSIETGLTKPEIGIVNENILRLEDSVVASFIQLVNIEVS